ncbi:2-phosphosulfolactate phosphatase [bacterium]|nr:2-phosphosulfolactate phosphatase [bacterium]
MPILSVHLTPALVGPVDLADRLVVVIDILRATTTMLYALAEGASVIIPVAEVDEASDLASRLPDTTVLLAGERKGSPIAGFDLGNSPKEFTASIVADKAIVFTTTNGTRAILHAGLARRVLLGAFVNFSAVCHELLADGGDVSLLCAGTDGAVALEDTLFAGAVVEFLQNRGDYLLDDGARLAWDTFEGHGSVLLSAFEVAAGGKNLAEIGLNEDLSWAAKIDRFGILAEVKGTPPRISICSYSASPTVWRTCGP